MIQRSLRRFAWRAFSCFPSRTPSATPPSPQSLAFVGATVYSSPTATPLGDAVVLTSGGVITAVGKRTEVKIPRDARVIDCTGKTIVAGFWNSHVHFTEPDWNGAATAPAAALEKHMQEMLTRWGFTTVWDLGSDPNNSLALRRRVEAGEVPGPKILLAGDIFPKNGHPVYLPPEMQLPEAATPDEASQMARDDLKMGLDGMKLFTGAFMGDKPVVNMDTAIVKAAVDVAHAQGKPVFAHRRTESVWTTRLAVASTSSRTPFPQRTDYTTERTDSFQVPTYCADPHALALDHDRSRPSQQPPMWCNTASTNSRLSPPMAAPSSFRHRRWFHCHLRHFARIRTDASRAVGQRDSRFTHNQSRRDISKPQERDASKKDWTPISSFSTLTLPPTCATSPKLPTPIRAGQIIYQK